MIVALAIEEKWKFYNAKQLDSKMVFFLWGMLSYTNSAIFYMSIVWN